MVFKNPDSEAVSIISEIYHGGLYGQGTNIQGNERLQVRVKREFVDEIDEAIVDGRVNLLDLVSFVANHRVTDAIRVGYSMADWNARSD